MTGRGSNLDKLELYHLINELQRFYSVRNHSQTVWNLNYFKSVTDAEFEPSEVTFLRLMPLMPQASKPQAGTLAAQLLRSRRHRRGHRDTINCLTGRSCGALERTDASGNQHESPSGRTLANQISLQYG